MREETLCFPMDDKQILLGKKRKGFGEGKWNGFGGKPELGETIMQAAVRELKEESGLITEEANLKNAAYLVFLFAEKPSWNRAVNVFTTKKWHGKLTMSDEMMPQWFNYSEIPYDDMWEDDRKWLPLVTEGVRYCTGFFVNGCFIFNGDVQLVQSITYLGRTSMYSGVLTRSD